ncbi:MAG: glycosyltransferase [Bacteroidales bacterium]|nr:glycosyltransferase [Bacteroidales bacterium]
MEKKNTQVIVDPECDILYSSFYIYGLYEAFGRGNVRFERLFEKSVGPDTLNFMVLGDGLERKVTISLADSYQVNNEELYDWCDVYGNVNANFSKTPSRFHDKMVALCPSFGIRCWNAFDAMRYAVVLAPNRDSSIRKHLGKFKRMLQRPAYRDYEAPASSVEDSRYVFFLSTLWPHDEWNRNDEKVNLRRADFIRACREVDGLRFEGGLVSCGHERCSERLFADCLCEAMPMSEWMKRTRRSALVFNTPAYWDCHGWKLGEYLTMGKCIVSTRLSNDLPVPLEHGVNVHFVDDNRESMKDGVRYILDHPEYAERLGRGASRYWEKCGSPYASLCLLGIIN